MYQVGIFQSKVYNGDCKGTALSEGRTRVLSFATAEDAVREFNDQVERAQAVLEYAKRHAATSEIYFSVKMLNEKGEIVPEYNWSSSYNTEE